MFSGLELKNQTSAESAKIAPSQDIFAQLNIKSQIGGKPPVSEMNPYSTQALADFDSTKNNSKLGPPLGMPTQSAQPFKPLNASEMHQTQRNYEENDPFSEVAPT